ncbi:hypothetical protein IJK16_00345 [Candidatus Saccharibacteria bacterium]|nr:hypothetical protein [Candidatus Saccharibacteria bacterium]
MKASNIATVVVIAIIGIIVSYIAVDSLLGGDPNNQSVTYRDIDVVKANLAIPDSEIFNSDAINPTIEVYVGNCVDADQNGVLDAAELSACGQSVSGGTPIELDDDEEEEEDTEEEDTEEEDTEEGGETTTEETESDTGTETTDETGDKTETN